MDLFEITTVCQNCGERTKVVVSKEHRTPKCQCGEKALSARHYEGVIYIMSNPRLPGRVKVGLTTGDVHQRAKQVSREGVPGKYHVDAVFPSHNTKSDEAKAHRKLKRFQKNPDMGEIFDISSAAAIATVRSALNYRDPLIYKTAIQKEYEQILEARRDTFNQRTGNS